MTELVYDLRTQPWSLGDVLLAQAAKLTECNEYDFVFLHDPAERPRYFDYIPPDYGNYLDWAWGAATSMKSTRSVSIRRATNEPREPYQCYVCMEKVSDRPVTLEVRDDLKAWAEAFHAEHGTIGTVNIRKHPHIPDKRDANVGAWREFLEGVEERLVILGDVPIEGNHIYPIESTERQLALISTAKLHMGSSSGPVTMAVHGRSPYRVFNTNAFDCMAKYFDGNRLRFGPPNRWFRGKEEYGLLKFQYESLLAELCFQ